MQAVVSFLILIVFCGQVKSNDETDLQFESLSSKSSVDFNELFGPLLNLENEKPYDFNELLNTSSKPTHSVWVLYQKNCKSCHQMMQESSKCLKKNKSLKIYFVGILSKKQTLLQVAIDHKVYKLAWYSKLDLIKKLNLDVTPTVFLFEKNKLLKRVESSMSCKEIKNLFNKVKAS